ncbi:MAG: hypothetical protein RIT04_271 [Candidatus Parcubacteria bacterium]
MATLSALPAQTITILGITPDSMNAGRVFVTLTASNCQPYSAYAVEGSSDMFTWNCVGLVDNGTNAGTTFQGTYNSPGDNSQNQYFRSSKIMVDANPNNAPSSVLSFGDTNIVECTLPALDAAITISLSAGHDSPYPINKLAITNNVGKPAKAVLWRNYGPNANGRWNYSRLNADGSPEGSLILLTGTFLFRPEWR